MITENLTFGQALQALKVGNKIARRGWNGKGMYLILKAGHPVDVFLYPSVAGSGVNIAGQMHDSIVLKTADDSVIWGEGFSDFVPWVASQVDLLAEDWLIIIA